MSETASPDSSERLQKAEEAYLERFADHPLLVGLISLSLGSLLLGSVSWKEKGKGREADEQALDQPRSFVSLSSLIEGDATDGELTRRAGHRDFQECESG